jgi:hypothetical protein
MLETVVRHPRRALVEVNLERNMPPVSRECNVRGRNSALFAIENCVLAAKRKRGELGELAASLLRKTFDPG